MLVLITVKIYSYRYTLTDGVLYGLTFWKPPENKKKVEQLKSFHKEYLTFQQKWL